MSGIIDEETPMTPNYDGPRGRFNTVASGELAGTTSATQLPDVSCDLVKFIAPSANSGPVYLGGSGVTIADGTTDTTTGLCIDAGGDSGWIPVTNLNKLYRIAASTTGYNLTYLCLKRV